MGGAFGRRSTMLAGKIVVVVVVVVVVVGFSVVVVWFLKARFVSLIGIHPDRQYSRAAPGAESPP